MRLLLGMAALAMSATAGARTPAADGTPTAAAGVVRAYYAAIEQGEYRTAYRAWSNGGAASGKTLDAFTRGFARTAHSRVTVGSPRDQEGAVGSLYITVPVRIDAVLKNGAHQRFAGSYVLRRVNGVPGATTEQRRWHLQSASLRPR